MFPVSKCIATKLLSKPHTKTPKKFPRPNFSPTPCAANSGPIIAQPKSVPTPRKIPRTTRLTPNHRKTNLALSPTATGLRPLSTGGVSLRAQGASTLGGGEAPDLFEWSPCGPKLRAGVESFKTSAAACAVARTYSAAQALLAMQPPCKRTIRGSTPWMGTTYLPRRTQHAILTRTAHRALHIRGYTDEPPKR